MTNATCEHEMGAMNNRDPYDILTGADKYLATTTAWFQTGRIKARSLLALAADALWEEEQNS